jgi:DNA-binding GntR family transcriptional regulator
MKKERYTKFIYTPSHHNDGLFNDPQASVSFIDRDTKKSKTFITADTGKHSKPNDQIFNIQLIPENANLLANIRYTNGKKYLIYKHYVPKRKLNKIEKAVYHNKRQYSDIVYAYISVNNKN